MIAPVVSEAGVLKESSKHLENDVSLVRTLYDSCIGEFAYSQ